MKVAVFGRFYNERTISSVERLSEYLTKKNIEVYIEKHFFDLLTAESSDDKDLLALVETAPF